LDTHAASLIRQAADAVASGQAHPTGALYVVATPIGNLADLTLRAVHVLGLVDAIACEDTRHSAPLLRQLGLEGKPLLAVHEHNERDAAAAIVERLARAERVAYVSDAGTPAISDPGAALVAVVRRAGHRVIPIPGASSAIVALSAAGDAMAAGFSFVGFLSSRGGERQRVLKQVAVAPATQVLFEAPHRMEALAQELASLCPVRALTLCRELTKQFETVVTMPASEAAGWLRADAHRLRGEFVVVLHALPVIPEDDNVALHDTTLKPLLRALPLKQAVSLAAELTDAPRNALYARALTLKGEAAPE
jgi:16S rRNA (cytidine1402-2'-O)-methyltransferase